MSEPKGTIVFCDHKDCLHLTFFENGPQHPPGRAPVDWDKGFAGFCSREAIGIKVRVIETYVGAKVKYVLPECKNYARRKDWRIHLPYPDSIKGGRILKNQEHGPSW